MTPSQPKISAEGTGALLVDGADGAFHDGVQARIWALARDLRALPGVTETVPGMNNLMVVFDPLAVGSDQVERRILALWDNSDAIPAERPVRDVPVVYGGAEGPDLADFAAARGLDADEVVRRHAAPVYSVAAVGAMPGFVYLSGLDPALAAPRLATPRQGVPKGSVIIGGSQAGIMPVTAPSGWHIFGRTELGLFDPARERPALFSPGDRIRFVPEPRR